MTFTESNVLCHKDVYNLVDESRGWGKRAKIGVFFCNRACFLVQFALRTLKRWLVGSVKLSCRDFKHHSAVGIAELSFHYHTSVGQNGDNRGGTVMQTNFTHACGTVGKHYFILHYVESNTVENLLTADLCFGKVTHWLSPLPCQAFL